MSNKDNIITISGKKFEVNIGGLEEFFETCDNLLKVHNGNDICQILEDAQDLLVVNATDDDSLGVVKKGYTVLRELKILFGFALLKEKR